MYFFIDLTAAHEGKVVARIVAQDLIQGGCGLIEFSEDAQKGALGAHDVIDDSVALVRPIRET
jgi:hypothetical protein